MSIDLAFFGLQEPPFSPAPNPRFLHMTPAHQEALAQLVHGVEGRKGFILLTGDIGTGKTTLLHALRVRLASTTAVAFITNSMLDFEGILEYVLEDLGVGPVNGSHAQRLIALQNFLTERRKNGQNTLLILDEAQDLDVRTLEYIRLLSNFETTSDKILQLILSGQPELRAKLDLPELRQLKQRLGLRCHLPPLDPAEVGQYIRTRLRTARTRDLGLFTPEAVMRIARYTGGIPRLINTVCDHGLVFAYADKVRRIDRSVVDEVIGYLEQGVAPRRSALSGARPFHRMTPVHWGVLGLTAAATAGMAGFAMGLGPTLSEAIEILASSVANLARSARGGLHQ